MTDRKASAQRVSMCVSRRPPALAARKRSSNQRPPKKTRSPSRGGGGNKKDNSHTPAKIEPTVQLAPAQICPQTSCRGVKCTSEADIKRRLRGLFGAKVSPTLSARRHLKPRPTARARGAQGVMHHAGGRLGSMERGPAHFPARRARPKPPKPWHPDRLLTSRCFNS